VDELHAQLDPAARNARDVQQVVDEAGHRLHLTHDDVRRLAQPRIGFAGELNQQRRVQDRRERIAQLVGKRREELVLAPIRLPERGLAAAKRGFGSRACGDVGRLDEDG